MTELDRVASLEASGRAALPALAEAPIAGWLLRVSGGDTKRVNSAHALDPETDVRGAVPLAEQRYAAAGLPCRFRLTPLAHPDADHVLADLGYRVADPSWTMVAAPQACAADPALTIVERAAPDAIALAETLSERTPAAAAVQARLLAAMPGPLALASVSIEGKTLATGYASVGRGRAQLSDVVVAPAARGRGLGRRLVAGLLGWAHARSCAEAMLQVLDANIVARGLYRSLGFDDAYPYHYRVS